MRRNRRPWLTAGVLLLALVTSPLHALEPVAQGAKVYIDQGNIFGHYLAAAFRVKGVPLIVVANRLIADYEITGHSESQKAGWAKMLLTGRAGSLEQATVNIVDLRTSEIVFAYNYNMDGTFRGKQSAAESCAKHLAAEIRQNGRLASSLPPLTPEQKMERRHQESERQLTARGKGDLRAFLEPTISADLAAVPLSQQSPKPSGVKFTSSPRDAEVQVDGRYSGRTPTPELTNMNPGEHTVLVKKHGFKPWERTIKVTPGEALSVEAVLEADPGQTRIAGLD
jgi:hypothetical protein